MPSSVVSIQPIFGQQHRFPYCDNLSDRAFEELLSSLFEKHFITGLEPYCHTYDTVSLMTGVGDRGRDVVLTKGERYVGLIQCKRLKALLDKPLCAQEIIKFALNAICDPSLITDRNEFTYYLAAATDFSEPAIELITSFNAHIGQEPDFAKWTTKVIRQYPASFGEFTFKSIEAELKDILSSITVKTINATKLNGWLAQDAYYPIAKQYFPPIALFTTSPTVTNAQIIDRFYGASSDLLTWPTTFGHVNSYHVEREETSKLLTWISEPIAQIDQGQPGATVAMLVGGAGYGKTTVIHDLLYELHRQNVPVIGLKADRLVLRQRSDLEEELHLPGTLNELVEQLAASYACVVVLIDQLDALSQSMSANRQGLQTYNRLIEQLALLPNTRIVISCRQYDLDYDPALVQYKKRYTVDLQPLSEAQVIDVLIQLKLGRDLLTPRLYQLLQIPLHLTIFCRVYKAETDVASLDSVQDLYHELWSQKILSVPEIAAVTSSEVRVVIQQIADQMYERQQISVPYRKFESEHKAAIDYLVSQSLITLALPKLQFFHQSFFDYVFARSFADRDLSITADIVGHRSEAKHQGLFIRSKVRQVLAYLREADEDRYESEVRTLLTKPDYRFHLKLLTLQHLASQSNPIVQERTLLDDVIQPNPQLWEPFLEAVRSAKWFRLLTTRFGNSYLALNTPETFNQLYQLCWRVKHQSPDDVIQFLSQLPYVEPRSNFISSVLFVLGDFSSPLAISLFEEANETRPADDLWFYHVMEHAMVYRPEWAGDQIRLRLLKSIAQIEVQYDPRILVEHHGHHQVVDTLEKLHQQAPTVAFSTGLSIVVAFLQKAKPYDQEWARNDFIVDSAFNRYSPGEDIHEVHDTLLAKLETWINTLLEQDQTTGFDQVVALLNSKYLTLKSLGLQGVMLAPTLFAETFYKKSAEESWLESHDWIGHPYFSRSVRKSFTICFPSLLGWQQQVVIDQILSLNPRFEYYARYPIKPVSFKWTGSTQYALLNLLPSAILLEDNRLKARYQELQRKFGVYKEATESGQVRFSSGRAMPVRAYECMSDIDWLNSFVSYDDRKGWRWEKVDEHTHAQRFTEEVKKRPARFVALIEQVIDRSDIPSSYVCHGLEGLREADCDPTTFKTLFFKSVFRQQDENYVSRMIWLTDHWIKREVYDQSAFEFLANLARNGSENVEGKGDGNVYNQGYNTIRGAALSRLYQWIHVDGFTEPCFQIMEQVAADGALTTRAIVIRDQAKFNHYDKQRSLRLFVALVTGYEVQLAETVWYSLQYDINIDFGPLIPFFEKAVDSEKARHILTQLLMVAYKHDYIGSYELLDLYIQAGTDSINGALDIALIGLTDQDIKRRERCWQIALRFLDHTDDKVKQAYLSAFIKFEPSDFSQLLPFLKAYSESEVGRKRDDAFYSYLLKCVRLHPNECIRLTSYFDRHLGPDITHRSLQNEPVEVILQAYNTLETDAGQRTEKEEAMNVFDRLMQTPAYRGLMNQILDKVDQ